MWLRDWLSFLRIAKGDTSASIAARRDRLAVLAAIATTICVIAAFLVSKGTAALMPGPLSNAHGGIETCSSCHSNSGSSKVSWMHGLVAGDSHADSKACLTCHKMPDTAFNAHGTTEAVLQKSTGRLLKVAARTPAPRSARAQNAAFPAHDVMANGLTCATCHQEHKGANFKLGKISNEQCRSCHVVKFDSFDRGHPKFEGYPFQRRTRIVYDHAGHFGKHFPEIAKKEPSKRIPATCSTCHNSNADKRVMAVAPFEQTCAGCHRDQITGKGRAEGPKGVAFLSIPGLDLQTLKKKNAPIGEWPDASDAKLTPFMRVMIARTDRGRALLKTVDGLNLQDLTAASDTQIAAVNDLAWEIKGIFHALLTGKASDVLGDFNIGGGATLSATLVEDLTASLPRDVIAGAQQEWLPNLAAEIASRPAPRKDAPGANRADASPPKVTAPQEPTPALSERRAPATPAAAGASAKPALPPAMKAGLKDLQPQRSAGPIELAQAPSGAAGSEAHDEAPGRTPLPSGTPRSIEAERDAKNAPTPAKPKPRAESKDESKPAASGEAAGADSKGDSGKEAAASSDAPPAASGPQTDDLLILTEEEQRGLKSVGKGSDEAGKADRAAPAETQTQNTGTPAKASGPVENAVSAPRAQAAPVVSIGSEIDPESWAEFGGWYRQDYAIFYRPTGHKDKFIYAWLYLTGPQAPKGGKSAASAVFDVLTVKDAQGSCTKCHSVDDIPGKGRLVNFSAPSAAQKQGHFTKFVHEPHFSIMENRGCMTCHTLEKDRPYLKSYEQGDAAVHVSNFGDVEKDLCKGCHNSTMVRQDCGLCHAYHVNGVSTPIISTKVPVQ